MAAAGRNGDGCAVEVVHLCQLDDKVAGGMDDFEFIADLEFILYVELTMSPTYCWRKLSEWPRI